jgi:hypothetical protein
MNVEKKATMNKTVVMVKHEKRNDRSGERIRKINIRLNEAPSKP